MSRLSELPALAVRRPTLILVVNLLIVIAGLAAFVGVEVRELPNVDRPVVSVGAVLKGASPETMDAEVTRVIEGAVARVAGVRKISATSRENSSWVRVQFQSGVSLDVAANDVREAVARIERQLPSGVEELTVRKADTEALEVVFVGLTSDEHSRQELTRLAEEEVETELAAIPGVAGVGLFGRQERVLRIVVEPLRLASYGLSIDDVAAVLRSTDLDVPAGSLKSEDQMLLVRANASVWQPSDIEALTLREDVQLGDVARAFFGPADASNYSLLNGRRAVVLTVIRQPGSNTIEISAAVDRALERLRHQLPKVEMIKTLDAADFIRVALREVLISLALAVAVVLIVIFVFLGALRPTLVPAAAIPVALIGTIAAIWLLGFSINILTLLALVLATGLIVDDAIVVVENVQRKRREGLQPLAAAVVGTREVFFAVIATTVVLVAVFLPITFLPTRTGKLFAEFGFVLAIAVGISSFVALTLGCTLSSRLAFRDDQDTDRGRAGAAFERLGRASSAAYRRLLDFTLSARLLVMAVAVLLAAAAVLVYPTLDEELLPTEDRGAIQIALWGPDAVGLDYMDRQSAQAEAILAPLRERGEIALIGAVIGRWDENSVSISAPLIPWSERTRSQQELEAEVRPDLQAIPGARARIRSFNSLNIWSSGRGLQFAITGPDHESIAAVAFDFVSEIRTRVPQLESVGVWFRQTQPQLILRVDRRRAEDLGVPVEGIAETLRAMIDGFEVAELSIEDQVVPVMLESAGGAIDGSNDLQNLFVPAEDGRLVPLSAFVSLRESAVAASLGRAGQKRAVTIGAYLPPGHSMSEAFLAIEELGKELLPEGYGLIFVNDAADLRDKNKQIALTFGIAVLVVLLVLAAQFESLLSALVIVLTVPFGLAAAVFALKLTDTTLNIYSQFGLIMLVGLMAKNGILVVEFADQLRDRGLTVMEAVRGAAIIRLRPVMMTMLSTVLSALPLVLASGAGAEARQAIGWVVFGGLGIATLFTLILIPVIYSLLAPLAPARAHAGVRLDRELREAGAAASNPATDRNPAPEKR